MYNTCSECRAAFRLYPGKINPDIITSILCIEPTEKRIRGEYIFTKRGNKRRIAHSVWFLVSDVEITSTDLRNHLMFIVQKFGLIKNIPLFLQKNMADYQRKTDIDSTKKFNQIYMGINCSWYPEYDHGGPILDISIMQELSQLNIQINFDIYFTYDISTILAFQKAAEKLGVGKNLNNHDWIDILIYIKKIYNIPPSTLGTVCENGDFLDDEGMLICSLREFVS
ncbi:MAG: hypothetical protein DBX67_07225 [Desulfovibrionaceae bacterium]|nr:MAG: hypothetical protein DBX67_07225 [Desulfovibrionaceae bacterium]